jgi:hypothetical protein
MEELGGEQGTLVGDSFSRKRIQEPLTAGVTSDKYPLSHDLKPLLEPRWEPFRFHASSYNDYGQRNMY